MTDKVDLFNTPVTTYSLHKIVNLVTYLAIDDFLDCRDKRRSGAELCEMFTTSCRKGHERMASSIYNNVRWSLDVNWRK